MVTEPDIEVVSLGKLVDEDLIYQQKMKHIKMKLEGIIDDLNQGIIVDKVKDDCEIEFRRNYNLLVEDKCISSTEK